MAKINYYSNKAIKEHNAQYNILIGERSNGKSYCIKLEECLKPAIKAKKQTFILVKRLAEDTKKGYIEEYFADMPIEKLTKGEYNYISGYRDDIYLSNLQDDGKIVKGIKIGKVIPLSNYERYKSRAFPDVNTIVYEEFVTDGLYLRNEVKNFMNLVSTVFRRRKGCRAWLIANTISRICPYFTEWSLRAIPTMKLGQIDEYIFHENGKEGEEADTKICVELCANAGEAVSGMFFGKYKKSIDGGAWETDEYPHLPEDSDNYDRVYTLGLVSHDFGFNIVLMIHKTEPRQLVYIYPASRLGEDFRLPERQIRETFSDSFWITSTIRDDIIPERMIRELFRAGKVVYSHNLCGADFNSCYKNMKTKPF